MERGLAALEFEAAVFAPVVPQPEAKEDRGHKHTIDNGGAGEIEHDGKSTMPRL